MGEYRQYLITKNTASRRTVTAFTSAEESREYAQSDTLDGAPVLPGFSLSLEKLFAELDRQTG
jgi:hypothetical protein